MYQKLNAKPSCVSTLHIILELPEIVVDFGKKKHLKSALPQKALLEHKKHLVNIILLTKCNKKVLTIKLFSLFFIYMIKFLRTRCKCK